VRCETCAGQGSIDCPVCAAAGKVVRYRDVIRRFETRIHSQALPFAGATLIGGLSEATVRRAPGETVWDGLIDDLRGEAHTGVPEEIWRAARELTRQAPSAPKGTQADGMQTDGRRVISRRVRFSKVPVTRVEYTFAESPFSFVAVGRAGEERFWAESFPPRWSRVQRFISALTRDQDHDEVAGLTDAPTDIAILEEYRARRRRTDPGAPAGANQPETPVSGSDDASGGSFRAADD